MQASARKLCFILTRPRHMVPHIASVFYNRTDCSFVACEIVRHRYVILNAGKFVADLDNMLQNLSNFSL